MPSQSGKAIWGDRFDEAFGKWCEDEARTWYDGTASFAARFGFESPINGAVGALSASMMEAIFAPMELEAGGCASPIEEAMLMALLTVGLQQAEGAECGRLVVGDLNGPEVLRIRPQTKVGRFRVDFQVELVSRTDFDDVDTAAVLVECDGHDYHERTKAQAKRDKSRDRALQSAGHQVLHYTGSEIWADPYAPATEVYDFLSAKFHEKWERNRAEAGEVEF